MKQVVRKGLRDIIVDDVPAPSLRPNHVLVQPAFSLISSGTETASIHKEGVLKTVADNPSHIQKVLDVMRVNGPVQTIAEVRAKFSDYAVLGYAGAGWVIGRHDSVKDLKIGDRVSYGGEGTGHGEVIMTGRNLVARVPDGVPLDVAAFTTLGSIALNAVRIAQISLGETVVVLGLGLVGQLVSQLARLQGGRVIATDLDPSRVELAREAGADSAIVGGASMQSDVMALTNGRGADCVIIAAAAKSAAPCQQGLGVCRDRGRIVVVGAVEMSFPWLEMYLKEIQLFMARAYGPGSYDPAYEQKGIDYPESYVRWTENRNMEEFLRLVDSGGVRLDALVSHRFRLDDAARAYETIMTPGVRSLGVLLEYPSEAPTPGPGEDATTVSGSPLLKRTVEIAPRGRSGQQLQVALVGAGNIARWAHMPALKRSGVARLRAVYSAGGARGKSYGLRYGASYATSSLDELLADPDLDAVIIASRNQDHAPQALAALQAGKHVFVEKPMALTEDECRELVEAEAASSATLMVGFNRRFAPDYVEMRRRLESRSGPVVINCRVNSPGISGGYWMADPAIGGAILGEACHFTDFFAFLLGSEPQTVSAYSLPTGRAEPIGENNIVASFAFADGSLANLTYCTVGSRTSGGERVEVFGSGIGLVTENFRRMEVLGAVAKRRSRMFADKGYDEQFAAFCQAVTGGATAPVTVQDGTRATVMCLRILESARTGEPCKIDWQRLVS